MNAYEQAISFANNYFALADGLVSGLGDYLAEDAVLVWFGRVLKGRKSIAAFIEGRKATSRHIFVDIIPTAGISQKIGNQSRKRSCTKETNEKQDVNMNNISSTTCFDVESNGPDELNLKQVTLENEMTCNRSDDLSAPFKPAIASTCTQGIERGINRIKLEEEVAPSVKAVKRECCQGDGTGFIESGTMKYIEANGEIEFSRVSWTPVIDNWDIRFSTLMTPSTWRRFCKLKIAYSEEASLSGPQDAGTLLSRFKKHRSVQVKGKLPSLEDINQISDRLVPNVNNFGGYLRSVDLAESRNDLIESMEIEMAMTEISSLFSDSKPKTEAISTVKEEGPDESKRKKFTFNYKIHLIIYESNSGSKVTLSRQFDTLNI